MKKFLLILTACILSIQLFAQEIYGPAQIINLNGDTSQVLMSNFTSAKEISYKILLKDKISRTTTPGNIKGYIANRNTYLSKYIHAPEYKLDNTFRDFPFIRSGSLLKKNNEIKPHQDSLFLQLLVKGKINLYQYTANDEVKIFYVEKSGQIHELPPVYFDFKVDSTRNDGYFIINGLYYKTDRFKGAYTEQKNYIDTLKSVLADNEFYLEKSVNESLKTLQYTTKDLITLVVKYNSLYSEEKSEIVYKKKKLGRIYFGFIGGSLIAFKDYYAFPEINTYKEFSYHIFSLIPNYGKNQNLFYKVGFQHSGYKLLITEKTGSYTRDRQITSIALGLRYAVLKGYFRPYGGFALTYTAQKVDSQKLNPKFPLLFELGGLIPFKNVNLIAHASFSPVLYNKNNRFQLFNYGIGLMF